MSIQNTVIAVYDSHIAAERAILEIQRVGFPMKNLSIVGKDFRTEEHVVGFYNSGERMKYWGKLGAFWGGLWGMLVGSAIFFVPGIGPIMVFGPLGAWILGALDRAVAHRPPYFTAGVACTRAQSHRHRVLLNRNDCTSYSGGIDCC